MEYADLEHFLHIGKHISSFIIIIVTFWIILAAVHLQSALSSHDGNNVW